MTVLTVAANILIGLFMIFAALYVVHAILATDENVKKILEILEKDNDDITL